MAGGYAMSDDAIRKSVKQINEMNKSIDLSFNECCKLKKAHLFFYRYDLLFNII
jgi:hypothetical protein